MRTSDMIFNRLRQEVDTVFYLPGGGAASLVDALGSSQLRAVCCSHEQGAGYAAVGYAQYNGFGVCLTTSGPGATNAITPCLAAWMDSVPVLFISGQVRTVWLRHEGMRFMGAQEADIIPMVKTITKLAHETIKPFRVMYWLEEAIRLCKEGRPGPCWLSIPMDVQGAEL